MRSQLCGGPQYSHHQNARSQLLLSVVFILTMIVTPPTIADNITPIIPGDQIVVHVPTGITTVPFLGTITQQIKCDVLPNSHILVEITMMDGNGSIADKRLVKPHAFNFWNRNPNNTLVDQVKNFTLIGRQEGRFYLSYSLSGDSAPLYRLSASTSVLVITERSQGWQGIWYELIVNTIIFVVGLSFFAWRRLHRLEIPIWTSHRAGLFERANFDGLPQNVFDRRYHAIQGTDIKSRIINYWRIPCHGAYVCNTCGIPAALLMNFHADAAHLCMALAFFSITVLLPVNYMSGNSQTSIPGNSFQQTTISNVPLYSQWFWFHVIYCYFVAALVIAFLLRQNDLLCVLRRRTKRIVGNHSIFIQHGFETGMTKKRLLTILTDLYPTQNAIQDISIIYDFSELHYLLDRRRELNAQLERMRALDAGYAYGMLSWNLLWCPGSVMLPSPSHVLISYFTCRPCRYLYRHRCGYGRCDNYEDERNPMAVEDENTVSKDSTLVITKHTYSKSDRDIIDPSLADEFEALEEELDFFPEEAIEMYAHRKCIAAFVIFDTTARRNDFVQLVRARSSCVGRTMNLLENQAHRIRYGSYRSKLHTETTNLDPFLSHLVLRSAPEPDDVLWKNLEYQPLTMVTLLTFLIRHMATIILLLLFSTPTAVLVYVKLDSSSGVYRELYAQHSTIVSLIATYLPSLLLISVNWCLLEFLYHTTMMERSISDSQRIKSFLVKGFCYLVVSSVFLPSIGVTAAYLAFSNITTDDGRKSYVESFLYKISGTFFISYICQRTFLGSIIALTRMGERLAYQPWIYARSITPMEQLDALRPAPYYYGHDYAMLLSVFLVILLGTVITPILTLFGALFFYVKFMTIKYNFLYVIPYTPGRGHIAQTAYTLLFVCLLIFEVTMAFVLLQIAGRQHFVAMMVLLSVTVVFYFLRIADKTTQVRQTANVDEVEETTPLTGQQNNQPPQPDGTFSRAISLLKTPGHVKRTIFSPSPSNLEQDVELMESYTDPYKAALSIFKLLGVNEFHRMSASRTQLKHAFHRLKKNMRMAREREEELMGNSRSESPKKGWRARWRKIKNKNDQSNMTTPPITCATDVDYV